MSNLTNEDKAIIMGRWAFDPQYMACNTANMDRRESERVVGDMQNSQGVVGNVKHRIWLVHEDGAELIVDPRRHDNPYFSPSRIAVY